VTSSAPRTRIPKLQRGWLVVYWIAFVITTLLLIQAFTSASVLTFVSLVAITLATTAVLVGALLATRMVRRRVANAAFVKGTTTTRVIAVAWILIQLAIYSGAIVSTIADVDISMVDWTGGFLGTAGSLSILAMLGPGYSEYREAVAAAEKPIA
jgi:hypothetical protein